MEIQFVETKAHLSESSGYQKAPCKIKPVCYLIIHEPEIQTWTPPNVTEFKNLTSQIRSFYATLMQGGPILCLSEYLNLPTSIPKHEQSNTHNERLCHSL